MKTKFTNYKQVSLTFYIVAIITSVLFLITCFAYFFEKSIFVVCIAFGLFFINLLKLIKLKYLIVEVSTFVLTVKYRHPLKKGPNFPVLDVPFANVSSYDLSSFLLSNYLSITLSTSHGKKKLQYKIGQLSKAQKLSLEKTLSGIELHEEKC
ncbi:hypothetical protein SAMN05660477_00256 [Soonwooa buanensis]|uniref:PH domain-containing protein n=1 Tax=Soonwooa buanensis TaxID=619805 RepID=A0A1T5CQJ6_9FLAO|nr:hypothetical protein [Soonwooa buanensis]SKB61778.1 hypothetical protein SAMN05660477_00256 [Soonwooa buanensis]